MLDIKVNFKRLYLQNMLCPFCQECNESFDHNFSCLERLLCHINDKIHDMALAKFLSVLSELYSFFVQSWYPSENQ